ncbi:ubiquinone biosynthesis monooxygenase Coq7 [Angomonas deanei]|uniref:5-demethoxyubiquinone hydroxylase, mitochondrial n=1 Tax=Angomonas deanei TaxID=59799 RepID=S9URL6_9TRYP|nr:ubiquinone biosynthesis monooxygenase Coq7 [Angomonas deanei]EPY31548.1 ubiquinone biosynthesis monooxygenase Coq7 [Angomonas deanei]|eukprot:EPY31548.1 ubiquinone biosynthesis monooxygenase Coq7 [Angomonas deanei]
MLRFGIAGSTRIARAVFAAPIKQKKIDEIVRVDNAGEVAAVRIAANQLRFMSPLCDSVPIVKEILDDEIVHRRVMDELAEKHGVSKTVLDPFFKAGAFVMGAGTALLGKEAMMCCHAAVEITIFDHYNDQLREMEQMDRTVPSEKESEQEKEAWDDVKKYIVKFRDEEKHHQELGEQNGAAEAPAYPLLYNGIRYACMLGVELAKRI